MPKDWRFIQDQILTRIGSRVNAVAERRKNFRQRRSDGNGGWIWNLDGVRRVPYRLRELLESTKEPVFIAEGPKDTDRLREEGLTATTNPMGAQKWSPEYNGFLQGRHIVVLPDMDPPNPAKPAKHCKGQRHGQAVANSLYGTAASVRYLELPGLPEHGDVSDWFDQGHISDELLELARKCPEWNPEIVSDLYRDGLPSETKILTVRTAREIAETTPESPD
jgi:putative DNA primase/helicase